MPFNNIIVTKKRNYSYLNGVNLQVWVTERKYVNTGSRSLSKLLVSPMLPQLQTNNRNKDVTIHQCYIDSKFEFMLNISLSLLCYYI